MLTEEQKIIKEYRSLCNRILHKDCIDLEHARLMIKVFNHYTERGKHKWDRKRVPTRAKWKRILGRETR